MAKKITKESAEPTALINALQAAIQNEAQARAAWIEAQKARLALEFEAETGKPMSTPFRFPKLENRVFFAVFDINKAGEVRLFREGNRKAERAPFSLKHDLYEFIEQQPQEEA